MIPAFAIPDAAVFFGPRPQHEHAPVRGKPTHCRCRGATPESVGTHCERQEAEQAAEWINALGARP